MNDDSTQQNMKNTVTLILSALAVVGLVSCNKNVQEEAAPAEAVRIEVHVDRGTRATDYTGQQGRNDSVDEAKVNTLQVLVFNESGVYDGYGSSTGTVAVATCTAGTRKVYAVVNAPDLSSVTSEAQLLGMTASLASVAQDGFTMIGSTTAAVAQESNIGIAVDRMAARVVIREVVNNISNDAVAATFKLNAIYLTNVAGDVDYGFTADYTAATWYNRRGYEADNNLGTYTYDAVGVAVAKGEENSYKTPHYLYTMPNGKEGQVGLPAGATTFTPRAVRLLVRAEINGVLYNYPILIQNIAHNKSYEINKLVLTKLGNPDDGRHDPDDPDDDDEEKPVTGLEQGFEITVNEWDVVLLGDNGNIEI